MVRLARQVAAAGIIGVSVSIIIFAVRGWTGDDSSAYWNAALRIRDGLSLYPPYPDPGASDVYRYAPWFAYLWVLLTYLPKALVTVMWTVLLVGASAAAVSGLARKPALAPRLLAAFFGSMLLWTAARGNVQPLMIWALVAGLPHRSGPLWIALAASLKAVPMAFVLIYVARRDWLRVGWTLAITGILVAPMPFLGWKPIDPGPSLSLFDQVSSAVWAVIATAATALAILLAVRQSRYSAVGAALAAILTLPRLLLYDVTLLAPAASRLIGIPDDSRATSP